MASRCSCCRVPALLWRVRLGTAGRAIESIRMSELVETSKHGEIGVLTVKNPPVNALSPGVPEGIAAGVEAFEKDPSVQAIVLIGGGRTFIAGAELKGVGKMK